MATRHTDRDVKEPDETPVTEPKELSLVLGGPLYQFWRRTRLCGDALQLLHRRIVVFTGLAWVPLLVLSVVEGRAWGDGVTLPFLYDVESHARLLLAVPLLILAELVLHRRMSPVVPQFVRRGIIPPSAVPCVQCRDHLGHAPA